MSSKILIVDDDPAFRKILQLRLKSFLGECDIQICDCLTAARNFLNTHSIDDFDLIVLDQHLPDGTGTELLNEGIFQGMGVLSVSSDEAPEIPGASLEAGASFFMSKKDISDALFQPLVRGIISRNKLQKELNTARLDATVVDTIKTLVGTLKHEINNPLGAVLGAAYLIRNQDNASPEQIEAAELVESSGQRIKHVLDQLANAIDLELVNKANHRVFHIPGDEPWEK